MKKTLLILSLVIASVSSIFAQNIESLKIIHPGESESLNNTTQVFTFATDNLDHEVDYWVLNQSGVPLTVNCRRIETDVLAETRNNVCWLLCPAFPKVADDVPDWLVSTSSILTEEFDVDETVTSFAFHYYPDGHEGSSLFNIKFVNSLNTAEVYAEFNLRFDHFPVGINDIEKTLDFSMIPNPANENLHLEISDASSDRDVVVYNVLGEVVIERHLLQNEKSMDFNTSDLENGIYMVSILQDNSVLKTSRLMIRH